MSMSTFITPGEKGVYYVARPLGISGGLGRDSAISHAIIFFIDAKFEPRRPYVWRTQQVVEDIVKGKDPLLENALREMISASASIELDAEKKDEGSPIPPRR